MRALSIFCMLLISMAACGPAGSTPAEPAKTADTDSRQISEAVAETVEQALKGDFGADEVSEASCAMFENGVIPKLFGIDAVLITYRRAIPVKRVGHVVCFATWDKPDAASSLRPIFHQAFTLALDFDPITFFISYTPI